MCYVFFLIVMFKAESLEVNCSARALVGFICYTI